MVISSVNACIKYIAGAMVKTISHSFEIYHNHDLLFMRIVLNYLLNNGMTSISIYELCAHLCWTFWTLKCIRDEKNAVSFIQGGCNCLYVSTILFPKYTVERSTFFYAVEPKKIVVACLWLFLVMYKYLSVQSFFPCAQSRFGCRFIVVTFHKKSFKFISLSLSF